MGLSVGLWSVNFGIKLVCLARAGILGSKLDRLSFASVSVNRLECLKVQPCLKLK